MGSAAATDSGPISEGAPPRRPARLLNIYLTTFLGLLIGFGPTFIKQLGVLHSLFILAGISNVTSWYLVDPLIRTLQVAGLCATVLFLEREPLRSVGLKMPTLSDLGLGLALFAAVEAANGLFSVLLWVAFPHSMANVGREGIRQMMRLPVEVGLMIALTNGIGEELVARGFAINRLGRITGSVAISSALALALDLSAHVPFWGWRYAIVIAPSQLLFVLVYLWRGDLAACIPAHILTDALPFLSRTMFAALMVLMGFGSYHAILAQRDYADGEYSAAVAEYSRALEHKPNDAELLHDRARSEIYARNYAGALEDLDQSLRGVPGDSATYTDRSMAYFYSGHYSKALEDSDHAVTLAPDDSGAYSMRAYVYCGLGQYDKAIADLTLAIKHSRAKNADYYQRRAFVYQTKGDHALAIADLEEADRLAPGDSGTLEMLASAHSAIGHDDLALADLTRAIKANPADTSALDTRSAIYTQSGRYDDALADLRAILAIDPHDAQALNDQAWLQATCPEARFRDGKLALKKAARACDLTSWRNGLFIDTLAAANAESGDFTQAVSWQARALELMKDDTPSVQQGARERLLLYQQGKPYRDKPSGRAK